MPLQIRTNAGGGGGAAVTLSQQRLDLSYSKAWT